MLRLTLAIIFGLFGGGHSLAAPPPDNIIDFDRSVGFSAPRNITVHPAFGDQNLVYLIPNGLDVGVEGAHGPRAGLSHRGIGLGGTLILRVTPTIESVPIQDVVTELKTFYPNMRFAVPASVDSLFEVSGAGMPTQALRGAKTGDPLGGNIAYSIQLPALTVRALLSPAAYRSPLLVISGAFRVRGVSRDDQGVPLLQTRDVRVSEVFAGFCALRPELTLNLVTGQFGCIHPHYSEDLVRAIQYGISKTSADTVRVDGMYGPATDAAIREFEKVHRLPIDGLPSPELRVFMKTAGADTQGVGRN